MKALRAGIGLPDPASLPAGVQVINASRATAVGHCAQRAHNRYNLDLAGQEPPAYYLLQGQAGHRAVEALHAGNWTVEDAQAAGEAAGAWLLEQLSRSDGTNVWGVGGEEKCEWFADWLPRAMRRFVNFHRRPLWDKILATEEILWALYEGDWGPLLLMGTPDAIALRGTRLVNVETKFFSQARFARTYLQQQSFGLQPAMYLTLLIACRDAGAFGEEVREARVQGNYYNVFIKKDIPAAPKRARPSSCCGELDLGSAKAKHPVMAKRGSLREHHEAQRARLAAWEDNIKLYPDRLAAWDMECLIHEDIPMVPAVRERALHEIAINALRLIDMGRNILQPMRSVGPACTAYNRPCPYMPTCAGQAELNVGYGLYVPREPDYVDAVQRASAATPKGETNATQEVR